MMKWHLGVLWESNIVYIDLYEHLLIDPSGLNCPVHCPIPCGPGHMTCYGAFDSNGCKMPDTCIPSIGNYKNISQIIQL